MPRALFSSTRKRVAASARSTVYGWPELVVERARRGDGRAEPRRAPAASRSLVEVLPDEPVTPTTVRRGRRRTTARGQRRERGEAVGDHDATARRPAGCTSAATAPAGRRRRRRSRGRRRARRAARGTARRARRLRESNSTGPVTRVPGSACRPAGRRRSSAISPRVSSITRAPAVLDARRAAPSRSSNGCTTPAISWPVSCPLPATSTVSPAPAARHGGARSPSPRSPISTTSPRSPRRHGRGAGEHRAAGSRPGPPSAGCRR